MSGFHTPVLVDMVVEFLNCQPNYTIVDCTLGGGGHTEKILERLGDRSRVIAVDWDKNAIKVAQARLEPKYKDQVIFVEDNYANMSAIFKKMGVNHVNGILVDCGVSSHQVDVPEYGLSYTHDGLLDMRMDRRDGKPLRELLQEWDERTIAKILWEYGEERFSRPIARRIKENLVNLKTTLDLRDLVIRSLGRHSRSKAYAFASCRRVFQAFRIAVNSELENLEALLIQMPHLLDLGGRFVSITFHSLEDRIVKTTMNPSCYFKNLTKKVVRPSRVEIEANPRAASARLRSYERVTIT